MMDMSIWTQAAAVTFREVWLILLVSALAIAAAHIVDYLIIRNAAFRVARERQRRQRAALSKEVERKLNDIEHERLFREMWGENPPNPLYKGELENHEGAAKRAIEALRS